jgi:hypothetical protein
MSVLTELEAMPGFQLKLDLEALGRTGHVMYGNAEELSHHATQFLTDLGQGCTADVEEVDRSREDVLAREGRAF